MKSGGIAQRWSNGTHPEQLLTKESVVKMSPSQRRDLSPVEKYDILMGYYDFRTTNHELAYRGPLRPGAKIQDWEGFCNGVRCAGIMLPEPERSIRLTNPDGIVVEFKPADLKALAGASFFYTQDYAQIGAPTQNRRAQNQPNAAVFDMVLRYGLGKNKKPFIIDSHLGKEIWNETVVGYQRNLSEPQKLTPQEASLYPFAVQKVNIDLLLETLGEIDIKSSNKPTKAQVANGSLLAQVSTSYTLYLDSNNSAVDGKWHNGRSGTRGVDFAWFVGGGGADEKYAHVGGNPFLKFNEIEKLFKQSVQAQCSSIFR